jgi:hypothetical protein
MGIPPQTGVDVTRVATNGKTFITQPPSESQHIQNIGDVSSIKYLRRLWERVVFTDKQRPVNTLSNKWPSVIGLDTTKRFKYWLQPGGGEVTRLCSAGCALEHHTMPLE